MELDARKMFSLDRCVSLAESVRPKNWEKKSKSDTELDYKGMLNSGTIKVELVYDSMNLPPISSYNYGLRIFMKDELVGEHFEKKNGPINELYQKIDNRDMNKNVKEIREYIESN